MPFIVKLLISNLIIVACTQIGRKLPALAGLIATMPLTSLIVLVWLYADDPGDYRLLIDYTRGVLWGIIPTILFFSVTFFCLRRNLPLSLALAAGFVAWTIGAVVHQWFLK